MKTRQLFNLLAALVVSSLVLAACAGAPTPTAAPVTPPTAAPVIAPTAVSLEKPTVAPQKRQRSPHQCTHSCACSN